MHQSVRRAGIYTDPSGLGGVVVSMATVLSPVVDGHVEITKRLVVIVRKANHHCFRNLPENGVSDIFNKV